MTNNPTMTLEEIYKQLPESVKTMQLAGAVLILCGESSPLIYRTMDDENYATLLDISKNVSPVGTIQ